MAVYSQNSTGAFALTIDVEDYFHVSAFQNVVNRADWPRFEYRVGETTRRLLDLLDAYEARATFFVLGWVAARDPDLVRQIVSRGHELASHGVNHQKVSAMSPTAFEEDVCGSKMMLEDIGGVQVHGYRAPSFSVGRGTPFVYDALIRAGYAYSSSTHPIAHDHYGDPTAPRCAHRPVSGAPFVEAPVATTRVFGRRFSAAGGGWFRAMPSALSHRLLTRAADQLSGPIVFYLHPWEIDPAQPRIQTAPLKSRFRHYLNLKTTEGKFKGLLGAFNWAGLGARLGIEPPSAIAGEPLKVAS